MSFLPTRSFEPYITLQGEDGQDEDLHEWDLHPSTSRVPVHEAVDSSRHRPDNALNAIKTFGRKLNPFSKNESHPAYSSIELGNITRISSNVRFNDEVPLKYSARKGWRKGIIWSSVAALVVLLLNVLFLGISYGKHGATDGVGTLFKGQCTKASRMDSGMHVVINIMSTLLLGASNYVMQILGAPTRSQIDAAHAQKRSLFIGVPNIRNLKWVGLRRTMLWLLLGLSALPLHLFWNSAVFSTLQANQYDILVVSNDFVNSDTFDCNLENLDRPGGTRTGDMDAVSFCNFAGGLYNSSKNGTLKYLDNVSCMKAYSEDFLSGKRNLLAVSNDTGVSRAAGTDLRNGSIFDYMASTSWQDSVLTVGGSGWMPNSWICSAPESNYSHTFFSPEAQTDVTVCDSSLAIADSKNWKLGPNSIPIDYCLSEIVPEVCELQYIVQVMIIVIVCNVVKLACMVLTVLALTDRPLVVVGDAIASCLGNEDESSQGQCLTVMHSKHERPSKMSQRKHNFWTVKEYQLSSDGQSRMWSQNKNRWFTAPKMPSWIICIILCLIFLAIASVLLHVGIVSILGTNWSELAFSSVSPSTLITWFSTSTSLDVTSEKSSILFLLIIITNSPQLLFSWLYFLYNALYTSMLSAHEILSYSKHRKALRVSYPDGLQRSTYWLQLPFRYSVPLLVASSLLHWLISQSLFIARMSFYDAFGQPALIVLSDFQGLAESNLLTLPGYNPKALVAAIVLGVVMIVALVGTGLRKFDPSMPLIGNDSWAISAACHGPEDSEGAANKRLAWGVVGRPGDDGVNHCAFSSTEVEPPVVGQYYA